MLIRIPNVLAKEQVKHNNQLPEDSAERGIEDAACVRLTGIYHNLIRYWAEI